ncbi:MAG: hypothetical protein SFV52_01240 [Saprospiraceae bacterium]|nr:hypothetical protein [Saprospiraceae bacterium]
MKLSHGNANDNDALHHLYEIWDKGEDRLFKYGVSDDPIDETDGLSDRIRDQLYFLNLAMGWVRFVGKILIRNINGRVKAKMLEREYIDNFEKAYGQRPQGNPLRRKTKFDDPFRTDF